MTEDSAEMPDVLGNVKVFIASSNELANDRQQLISTLYAIGKYHKTLKVEPVTWETDIEKGNYDRECIQDELNELLWDCQIVIVLFHSKVGKFTLEEYNLAVKCKKKVFVYFKGGIAPKNIKEFENLQKVFQLKEFLDKENQTIYVDYETVPELANNVQQDMNLFIARHYALPVREMPTELDIYLAKVHKTNVNQQISTSEIIFGKSLNDLDEKQLIHFFELERVVAQFMGNSPNGIEEKLNHLGLLQADKDLLKGTFMCLGKNIGNICKNAVHSKFFLFEGTDKVNPVLSEMVTGNLIDQYEKMIHHLKRNLYLIRNVYSDEPEDREIPEIVLRELLANAFVHRDYGGELFTTIQVELYQDRLEIKNPGNFPDEIKLETIGEVEVSFLRNPEIAEIFFLYNFVEAAGSGIKRIQKKLKEKGLEPAIFTNNENSNLVKVTVYKKIVAHREISAPIGLLTMLPPTNDVSLIGREPDLLQLQERLKAKNPLLLVNGLGGIGKTELCKRFFLDHYKDYESAAWVDYRGSLGQSLITTLAESFHLSLNDDPTQLLVAVLENLRNLGDRLLLVVDNIEDPEDKDLINLRSLPAVVLVTSRNKLAGFSLYPLDVLPESACLELFYRFYFGPRYDEAVKAMIQLSGCHTLTIELLARTATNAGLTAAELLQLLTAKGFDLSQEVKEGVATYWHDEQKLKPFYQHLQTLFEISALTTQEEQVAMNLSVLPAQFISRRTIKELLNLESLDGLTGLLTKGWLKADEKSDAVVMHQIVSHLLRTQTKPDAHKCEDLIDNLKWKLSLKPEDNPLTKAEWVDFAAQLLSFITDNDENLAALVNNLSQIYSALGQMEKALEFQEKATKIWEAVLAPNHPHLATSYNNLSTIYQSLGQMEKALEFQEKATKIREAVLAPNHPDLATSYNNLSQVYQNLGQMEKALEFQEKTVNIFEAVLAPNHPHLATSYNNISMIYQALGQMEKALEFQEKAIKINEAVLAPNHPDLATSYNNLSLIYLDLNNLDSAHFFSQKAVHIFKTLFPGGHPNLTIMEENLAIIEKRMKLGN